MNLLTKFRAVNWGIVVLCFFLPFSRGCNNEIRYLNVEAMQDIQSFLIRGLPVLYPVLLLLGAFILNKLNDALRFKIARLIYIALVILLSCLVFQFIDSIYRDLIDREALSYTAILVLLWGLMMFGWVRSRNARDLQMRMAFLLTAVSAWFFPLMVLLDKEFLIGAWIFMITTTSIIMSYLLEYEPPLLRRKKVV
jgi:hypothetical protein